MITTLQQLDDILNALYASDQDLSINNLHELFPQYSTSLITSICLKLNKDENAINRGNSYFISFEGRILKEKGGCVKREKREATKATLQSLGSKAIVWGTLLAGLYVLWQVWIYYFPCKP